MSGSRIAGLLCLVVLICCGALLLIRGPWTHRPLSDGQTTVRMFQARGVIESIAPEQNSVVISHEAIPNYMQAMTMPFNVRRSDEMRGLNVGDRISFVLSVTETQSWIDQIRRIPGAVEQTTARPIHKTTNEVANQSVHPLLEYGFTNELGQPVRLRSFEGQALAITFFFTRCPIPEFCPRLSHNFADASHKLSELAQAPTNWHFLSITFDPTFDTPPVLKAYAERYHYDPQHWSFITGPKDKIGELARLSNVEFEPDSGLFNHNFRTMIIDASGRLQMVFPLGGDLSEAIVSEILKASAVAGNKPS